MFITFEGIEGCGKTTQIELLFTYLRKRGYRVIKTREPGGTAFGEMLRETFLRTDSKISSMCELLIFAAMRAQHVEEIIEPALKNSSIVLCDRFSDATYAYQGYGRGVDIRTIKALDELATKGVSPDLTIVLDCPAKEGLLRKARSADMDRFEKERVSFHNKVRKGYKELAEREPRRFFVIDGTLGVNEIRSIIRRKVGTILRHYGI